MQTFTPAQWCLIDLANNYGLDAENYDVRLTFGYEILKYVREDAAEAIATVTAEAKTKPLFVKGLYALKDILAGKPTGHVIELDAVNSGPQILSVLLHCETGMRNTGIINTGSRPDGYATILSHMETEEPVERPAVKNATVPYAYGSDHKPLQVFGPDLAPEFEKAYAKTFPMASWIRQVLINAWDSNALYHEFTLPDRFVAHLECRGSTTTRSTIQGYTYSYIQEVNRPLNPEFDQGTKSLVANVTHAADAFLVREIRARCSYDREQLEDVLEALLEYKHNKAIPSEICSKNTKELQLFDIQAKKDNFVSATALEYVLDVDLSTISAWYLDELIELVFRMQAHKSFELFTIHDAFKPSPVNVEPTRKAYNQIMAELYESPWLLNVVEELTGIRYEWDEPTSPEIKEAILDSEYAIC